MKDFIIENSFRNMPPGEPFICSFSGGKDSVIALSRACEKGEAKGVIHWFNSEQKESVFHHQSIEIIQAQAKCMNLPLIILEYSLWGHRVELIRQYEEFARQGVKSIVFGDIYLPDSAKLQYILCKKAGLTPRFPLWGYDFKDLLYEMKSRNIQSIISRVNTAYLSESWLGKEYTEETFEVFSKLGIDPFGEKGEFHTTVVDADIFHTALQNGKIGFSSHELKDNIYHLLKK